MSDFLTVKHAAQLTGKSPSSIRRILYPILRDDHHPDRMSIQPSIEDAAKLRLQGENFAWRVSEEFLRRAVPLSTESPKASVGFPPSSSAEVELLAMLRRELDIKNQQIKQQAEIINGLGERLREGNILMGRLQQQLALPDGQDRKPSAAVKAMRAAPTEKGSTVSAKLAKPRKGLLSRLFGIPQ